MTPFLKSVARAYAGRYADLSELTFVFPSKRAGTFFLKYLRQEALRPMLAPEVITISDFVSEVADRVQAGRVDQLLRLYNAYRAMLSDDTPVDFDAFRGWGETVLSDFNEIDMYGVSADEIFKNVKDYREIASNFLTEEQKRVMEEYFGRPVGEPGTAEKFWRDFGEEGELSDLKRRFLHLWRVLGPLYHAFAANLDADGLAATGALYRKALERLQALDGDPAPLGRRKVVFIGFNALSRTEGEIFSELAAMQPFEGPEGEEPFADFWWDATGPVLRSADSTASRFVASNRRRFPHPKWSEGALALSETDTLPPRLRVIAAPSNTVQAKIISEELRKMQVPGEVSEAHFKDARVAVVLPDEGLLLPMLYSLPEDIGAVNLTMGYPLRLTSAISFVSLLRRLQMRQRRRGGEAAYFHEDVDVLLSHPYVHALMGSTLVQYVKGEITRCHLMDVPLSFLTAYAPVMGRLLRPLGSEAPVEDVVGYIDEAIGIVDEALASREEGDGMVKSRLDRVHLAAYRDALHRLADSVAEHGVRMHFSSLFALADRLLAGEQVTFEGEPLQGLQVMGMLETRAIDFDRLIIPSLNESILPMKARARTFIPDTLRVAYGMPPMHYRESLFAYYFYRLISRADEVVMLYDARSGGGMRSGDVSRYLLQLRHLYARDSLVWEDRRFKLSAVGGTPVPVEKGREAMALLREFTLPEGGRNLSASALMKYLDCPVRFYYEVVVGLKADTPPSRYIDVVAQGNIIHDVMMRIYMPEGMEGKWLETPVRVTRQGILALMRDTDRLDHLIVRGVNREHFRRAPEDLDRPLEGETALVAAGLRRQILGILAHDLRLAPFDLHGTEVPGRQRLAIPDGPTVNFKYAIDRVDSVGGLRVVDYKSGAAHLKGDDMDAVFSSDYHSKHVFQLFLYANLLNLGLKRGDEPVRTEVYEVSKLPSEKPGVPEIGGKPVLAHTDADAEGVSLNERFRERMRDMIREIFDPGIPFTPCEKERACRHCNLASLCRR